MITGINNIVFLYNNQSANHQRASRFVKDIANLLPDAKFKEYELFKGKDALGSFVKIASSWNKRTLVCIGGGDGSVNFVINQLLLSDHLSKKNQEAVLLPLWGGNANDLSVMLNGYPTLNVAKAAISRGSVSSFAPLLVDIVEPKGKKKSYLAGCYVSFGLTAHASDLMKESAHSRTRKTQAPVRLAKEMNDVIKASDYKPHYELDETKHLTKVYDRIFTNGPRIAKLEGLPVKLQDRAYFEVVAHKNKLHYLWYGFNAFVTKKHGKVDHETRKFTIKDETKMQIDGEVYKINPETRVSVSVFDGSLKVISRKT